jgi:hypothetical protein
MGAMLYTHILADSVDAGVFLCLVQVLYFKYAGDNMETTDGTKYIVLREDDILSRLTDKPAAAAAAAPAAEAPAPVAAEAN